MSDHADTIRREAEDALARTWAGGEVPVGPSIPDAFRESVRLEKFLAQAALDLLAERQQAIDERDAAQAKLEERNEAQASQFLAQMELRQQAEARCEQAIDALREIKHWPYSVMEDGETDVRAMKERAHAALVSLGETE